MTATCPVCGLDALPLGTRRGYRLHRCPGCRHLFVDPPPIDPLAIYSESYFKGGNDGFGYVDYDRDKEPMTASFQTYLKIVEAHSVRSGKLFDIGAATGFFLQIACERGWRVSGVEPCAEAAAIGRGKGLAVMTGVLTGIEMSQDVVTALDVIEHVPNPRQFVRTVRQVLRPGGLLAINTPDSTSVVARAMGVNWHAVLPPEHLQLFNRQSLRLLLEQEGFEVLSVHWIGKRFTVQYVLQTLSRWTGAIVLSNLANRLRGTALGRLSVPLNLHDNLFMLARLR